MSVRGGENGSRKGPSLFSLLSPLSPFSRCLFCSVCLLGAQDRVVSRRPCPLPRGLGYGVLCPPSDGPLQLSRQKHPNRGCRACCSPQQPVPRMPPCPRSSGGACSVQGFWVSSPETGAWVLGAAARVSSLPTERRDMCRTSGSRFSLIGFHGWQSTSSIQRDNVAS